MLNSFKRALLQWLEMDNFRIFKYQVYIDWDVIDFLFKKWSNWEGEK